MASLVVQLVKNLPAIHETWVGSLGWEDPLEKGTSYPHQYSGLENSMDRGAWWATIYGVTKSQTLLRDFHFHLILELWWWLSGKESACKAGEAGSIPGSGRSPGGRHGDPLHYSCLENPHGQRSLAGYGPWGCREWDTTERLSTEHTHSVY